MSDLIIPIAVFAVASMGLAILCSVWAISILAEEQETRYKDDNIV